MTADASAQLAEQVRYAHQSGSALCIRGAGSKPWLAKGDTGLDMLTHSGIVVFDPAERYVVVRAGTRLADLEAALAEQRQMLAAEPPSFAAAATVGGAMALGWSGSRRPFAGALRDAVLGVRMINGLGEVLSFGGQVMKNVAGFDVPRLLTGSLGRLGVIVDVSLRLVPMPPAEVTLQVECASAEAATQRVRAALQTGQPVTAASYCDGVQRVRMAGHASTLKQLCQQWGAAEENNDYWDRLRRLQPPLGAASGAALSDWNGALTWRFDGDQAVSRELAGQAVVHMNLGPASVAAGRVMAALHQQLQCAFDPAGIFSGPHSAGLSQPGDPT